MMTTVGTKRRGKKRTARNYKPKPASAMVIGDDMQGEAMMEIYYREP